MAELDPQDKWYKNRGEAIRTVMAMLSASGQMLVLLRLFEFI